MIRNAGLALRRGQDLPEADHVLRHVSSGRLRRDADRNVVGIRGDGLLPKRGEGLSTNWLEFTEGSEAEQISAAIAMMANGLQIRRTAVLAKINVGKFRALAEGEGYRIRVVYDPISPSEDEGGNEGHAEIRHLPDDNDELFDLLATDGIAGTIACADYLT